jgi:hypothetical protein
MSKGHSMRHGRSRCTSKIGPSSRAHRSKAIIRRQSIRDSEDGEIEQVVPNLKRGVSRYARIPEVQAPSVTEPIVTLRKVGARTVAIADYTGGVA